MKKLLIVWLFVAICLASCQKKSETITDLRCEYLTNPLALAVKVPHFSWRMNDTTPNLLQTAYQLVVWNQEGEYWNSGKVESGESVGIAYQGKPLTSNLQLKWKVTVWDNIGRTHESGEAGFGTGLYDLSDWKAQWIQAPVSDQDSVSFPWQEAFWIWYPEPRTDADNPVGHYFFRQKFQIADTQQISSAQIFLSGDDYCRFYVNGTALSKSGWLNCSVDSVSHLLKMGDNELVIEADNRWGGAGVIGQLHITFRNAPPFTLSTRAGWQVSKDSVRWTNAIEFAQFGKGDNLEWLNSRMLLPPVITPPPYMRKDFVAERRVKSARLYATALGTYQLMLNGEPIGNQYLAPGFTDYNDRILYQAYDVTALVKKGENCLSAVLSDGWYAGTIGWGHVRNHYGKRPQLLVHMQLTYSDGSTALVVSDTTWKVASGPFRSADLLDGVFYDSRLEMPDWNKPGFDDKKWEAVVARQPVEQIMADPGVPVAAIEELAPVRIATLSKSRYVVDFGQNMVGWVRLLVQGNAGDTVCIRHAEMLNPDGTLYTEALRSAKATDCYILQGKGEQMLEPLFTFHGFRYAEISGLKTMPQKEDIHAVVIHSDMKRTGWFECSDTLVNMIYNNARWGQKGNFLSIPTDCPQRDERLGWMGDAQVFVKTASYNMDVCAFFNKWMYDVQDAQSDDGAFSDVAPRIVATGNGAPAWGDAGVIVPLTIFRFYNNLPMLQRHYPAFKSWVNYVSSANPDFLWKNRRGADYGDWLNTNAVSDKEVVATAFFAYSANCVAQIASVLGNSEDEQAYRTLFESIRKAFVAAYVSPDGQIRGNTQTVYVLALAFDLLPDSLKPLATSRLVSDVALRGNHHSTGFVGIGHLLPVLTENGHHDLACRLITNSTFPSLGFMVKNGATTIWERWDGYTPEKGFQDPGMNSFNHYSLGSPTGWLYSHVAGITPLEPGFRKIGIKPWPGGAFTYAKCELKSMYGSIVSNWEIHDGKLNLHVSIPPNTTARISVPGSQVVSTLSPTASEGDRVIFEVGSGSWDFASEWPAK